MSEGNVFKIIFTGPVGAGKTTAVASISDLPPVSTDETASDMTCYTKQSTTVAMDYGILELETGGIIHLYGTPGRERFDFMWNILTQGGIGLILLVDNTRTDPFHDMHLFLKAFREFIEKTTVVIGVTRMDLNRRFTIEDYHSNLGDYKGVIPVFEIDAREKRDVCLLVQALLYSLDPKLQN